MADVIVRVINNRAVVQVAGAEALVRLAQAATRENAERAEGALEQIEQIAAGAPDAPSVLNKLDRAANLSDLVDAAAARGNLAAAWADAPNTDRFLEALNGAPDGGVTNRLGDRVFVGGAVQNDASFPNVGKDWLTEHENANGRSNGIIVSAQAAILTNDAPGSRVGLVVGNRTSSVSADTGFAQTVSILALQDRESSNIPIVASYSEIWRTADAAGPGIGHEIDPINLGAYVPITPYQQSETMHVALQLANGGEIAGVNDASAAINVRNNGAKFGGALIVGHDAVRGSDGATGTGHAIQLATRHQISWYDAAGNLTSGIFGGVTSPSFLTRLAFIDLGAVFLGPTNNLIAEFPPVFNVANYPSFQAAGAGGAVQIEAKGSDPNISVRILPKGSGTVQIAGALRDYADDAAAAAGGIPVEGLYRTGNAVKIRIA